MSILQGMEMNLHNKTAEVYIPDDFSINNALERTTHLAIAAHPDDIEIIAAGPIIECFKVPDLWFTGIVVTSGRNSPRSGKFQDFSDDEMRLVRIQEQKIAAQIGQYGALVLLDYESESVKDSNQQSVIDDITRLFETTDPNYIYTHNLADKHDTHVAVTLRVIQAIRRLPDQKNIRKVFGSEMWRDLDWVLDNEKVLFDLSSHEELQLALIKVYESQIEGGKRYDLATIGRRRANATYFGPHCTDSVQGLSFGMDLTPLISNPDFDIAAYVCGYIQRFAEDVTKRIDTLL